MGSKLETAVLFAVSEIEDCNCLFLMPQKILFGMSSEDTTNFESILDNTNYENIDEAVRHGMNTGFYYVKPLKELKKLYGSQNIYEIAQRYFEDLSLNVYYYENYDPNDFKSCFLKKCRIEDFQNKFNMKFEYVFDDEIQEGIDFEVDPISENFKNIKLALDSTIIFQNRAKKEVLATLYDNVINSNNNSHILISGPSGVGKTTFLKQLEISSSQPVVYNSFNNLLSCDTEGYLDFLLGRLYEKAMLNKTEFQQGIIIVDDCDDEYKICDMVEFFEDLISFFKEGSRIVNIDEKSIRFTANKITFILSGDFTNVNQEILVPLEFIENSISFENNLFPSQDELICAYGFNEEMFNYFTSCVSFDSLTYEQAKTILLESERSALRLYIEQLRRQGITTSISEEVIDLICKKVYSETKNLKNADKGIKSIFKDIIMESLEYVGQSGELIINKEILEKDKKGYELKLKNSSKFN